MGFYQLFIFYSGHFNRELPNLDFAYSHCLKFLSFFNKTTCDLLLLNRSTSSIFALSRSALLSIGLDPSFIYIGRSTASKVHCFPTTWFLFKNSRHTESCGGLTAADVVTTIRSIVRPTAHFSVICNLSANVCR